MIDVELLNAVEPSLCEHYDCKFLLWRTLNPSLVMVFKIRIESGEWKHCGQPTSWCEHDLRLILKNIESKLTS